MSFQEKTISASLVSFSVILAFYLFRLSQIGLDERTDPAQVFRLWGIVIGLGILLTIAATILTYIGASIVETVKTGEDNPEIEDFADERDRLIDLRGTRVTYVVFSIGVLLSMLSYVLGQPPLVMFALLILSGLAAQIIGDVSRLVLYRRGF
jgi:hypothetical protein